MLQPHGGVSKLWIIDIDKKKYIDGLVHERRVSNG